MRLSSTEFQQGKAYPIFTLQAFLRCTSGNEERAASTKEVLHLIFTNHFSE